MVLRIPLMLPSCLLEVSHYRTNFFIGITRVINFSKDNVIMSSGNADD
jgi:hypothetical protein